MPANLPWAIALAAAATIVPAAATGPWSVPLAVLAGVASYLAGRRLSLLQPSLLAFTVAAAASLAIGATQGSVLTFMVTALLSDFGVCVIPWWAGRYRRLRAEQFLRERALLTTQAQLRERARIATDMHDLLGHDLALLALSAGALELTGESPTTRKAAAEVRRRAAAATEKLHDIVGVLGDTSPSRTPAGESVEDLVERARLAGMNVNLERVKNEAGTPAYSPFAANALRRVAQESLTNAAKHGDGRAVLVRLDETADPVRLSITNGLAGAPRHHGKRPGQGLRGLHELVRISGGTMTAGPVTSGVETAASALALPPAIPSPSFSVTAEIPRQAIVARPFLELPGGTDSTEPTGPAMNSTVSSLRQRGRRQLWHTAAIPMGLAVVLLAVFGALQAVTVSMTALTPDNYARLKLGQSRTELAHLLPRSSIDKASPMLPVPEAPANSNCEFFQARTGILDFSPDMYRLCFRNDILASLDRLAP